MTYWRARRHGVMTSWTWRTDELDMTQRDEFNDMTYGLHRRTRRYVKTNSKLCTGELDMTPSSCQVLFLTGSIRFQKWKWCHLLLLSFTKFTIWAIRKISEWHQIIMSNNMYLHVNKITLTSPFQLRTSLCDQSCWWSYWAFRSCQIRLAFCCCFKALRP